VLWAERTAHGDRRAAGRGTLRFVFYGRVSTEDWQDPVKSRARQREQAEALPQPAAAIVPCGEPSSWAARSRRPCDEPGDARSGVVAYERIFAGAGRQSHAELIVLVRGAQALPLMPVSGRGEDAQSWPAALGAGVPGRNGV
jgi:hypothetical protein